MQEQLCFHMDSVWSLEEPACSNPGHSGAAAFVLHKQPPPTFQEQLHPPTHMALIGDAFFYFHCSHMFRAVTFLSSVCIWMAAFSLLCLSHASLRQPAPRASASTSDSVLSGARSAKHLLSSLPKLLLTQLPWPGELCPQHMGLELHKAEPEPDPAPANLS